jgi:type I restriction enzyme R subunit
MRQAIEEGFILDVLKNYTTYKLAFKLANNGKEYDEKEVEKSEAQKEIMQWVRLHPYNISQKVQVVVEHFRDNVQPLLGGRAKAMIVVGSRREAVRWQKAITGYIQKRNYPLACWWRSRGDRRPESYPEPVSEPARRSTPASRATSGGVRRPATTCCWWPTSSRPASTSRCCAACTWTSAWRASRRCRRCRASTAPTRARTPPTSSTSNDAEEVLAAFKTYYETARLEANTDPNLVFDLRAKLDATGFYDSFEVDRVAQIETDPKGTQAQLSAALAPVADRLLRRYKALQAQKAAAEAGHDKAAAQAAQDALEVLVLFKGDMGAFCRLYAFLSQIFDYGNTDIEKRFLFYKRLIPCSTSAASGTRWTSRRWC